MHEVYFLRLGEMRPDSYLDYPQKTVNLNALPEMPIRYTRSRWFRIYNSLRFYI